MTRHTAGAEMIFYFMFYDLANISYGNHMYLFSKDFTKLGNSLFLLPLTCRIFYRSATVAPSIIDSNLSLNC